MNSLSQLLICLSRLSCRRPGRTWLVALLLATAALVAAATRLELKTSNLDLVDPDVPAIHRFLSFANTFGTPNVLIVVLEGDDADTLTRTIEHVGRGLSGLSGVRSVLFRAPFDDALREELGLDKYILSRDGHAGYIFVQPLDATSSVRTIEPFVGAVRDYLTRYPFDRYGIQPGLTGIPEYAMNDKAFIQQDIKRLSLFALAGIVIVFMVGFGTWREPLIAAATLLMACIYTLGLASFVPGHLTLLSGSFVSILFGLGIDFGIHLIRRIEEYLQEGKSPREVIDAGVVNIVRSLLTGALTTSLVFFALRFAGLRGFGELGLIAGMGVLICLFAMITLLPAGLLMSGALARSRPPPRRTAAPPPGSLRLVRGSALAITALVAFSLFLPPPPYDSDYLDLQPVKSEAVRLERAMVAGSEFSPQFAAFSFDLEAAAQDLADRLYDEELVGEVRTLAGWRDWGLTQEQYEDIPASVRAQFVSPDGQYAVYAYPSENVWDPVQQTAFVRRMQELDPDVTGMPVIGQYMLEQSQQSLRRVTWIALVVLAGCLIADFKRLRLAAVAMMPAVMTFLLMRLWMDALHLAYNPINMMALPVILGIAVDDGVHLVHRYVQEHGNTARTLAETGKSVVMTSLTSMISFGMLSFASHRGLASFGQILFIGISTALAISLVWLPAVLSFGRSWWLRNHPYTVGDDPAPAPTPP